MSKLCPPVAAISGARLALSWPLTSARSSPAERDRREARLGRRQQLSPLEMIDDRQEARRRDHLHLAGPGRLAAAFRRTDDAAAAARRRQCREQYAGGLMGWST